MKKIMAIIAISAISFSASAQEKRAMKEKHPMEQGQRKGGKHHGKDMMKDLQLTEAQKAQVKTSREEFKAKMDQLKQNQDITVKEFNLRKEALQKEQKAKMQSILTPEQKNKMAELKANQGKKRAEMDAKRFDKMKTELALSNDQAAKLKAQNEASRARMKAIRDNEALSKEEKKQQVKALKEANKAERKNILTAEQIKKMEEMRKDRRGKDWKQSRK